MSNRLRFPLLAALAVCLAANSTPPAFAQSITGRSMGTMFNPRRVPSQKSMGLIQRSFLDIVETKQLKLQVALVLDGTDSMASELTSIRDALSTMMKDLERYKGKNVSFALVVYRDSGSPSGPVSVSVKNFTSDIASIKSALTRLKPENGAPYFFEAADLGIHTALTKLPWSTDVDTDRWVMMFADAPPFDEGFKEPATGAKRRYDTDVLIDLAKNKKIRLNSVLCQTRGRDRQIYEQVLDRTRSFMNQMATKTSGVMLDLSYPDIQKVIAKAANVTRVQHTPIGLITQAEVEAERKLAFDQQLAIASDRRVRVAVLPHAALQQVRYDIDAPSVKVAIELRQKLRMLPQVEVKSSSSVNRELRRIRGSGLSNEQALTALAAGLRVDYLVWGDYVESGGLVKAETAIYQRQNAQVVRLAKATLDAGQNPNSTKLAGDLLTKLARDTSAARANPMMALLEPLRRNTTAGKALVTPVSNSQVVRSQLLAGFAQLEQAMSFPQGDAAGKSLLEDAVKRLTKAISEEREDANPFALLLLGNAQYNLAVWHTKNGNQQQADELTRQFSRSLKLAHREMDKAPFPSIRTEIKADYDLLIRRDYASAIKGYEKLASGKDNSPLYQSRRAHWMLAAIYSGDWGATAFANKQKARENLVKVLAHWSDSAEAQFVRQQIRWSDNKRGGQFPQYPLENGPLMASIDRSEISK